MLLLDEPTNDLDVDTLRALEDALLDFAGCAVVISHDRWFLDRIATHMLAFEGDTQVVWFEGNYEEYERNRRPACRRRPAAPDQVQAALAQLGGCFDPFGGRPGSSQRAIMGARPFNDPPGGSLVAVPRSSRSHSRTARCGAGVCRSPAQAVYRSNQARRADELHAEYGGSCTVEPGLLTDLILHCDDSTGRARVKYLFTLPKKAGSVTAQVSFLGAHRGAVVSTKRVSDTLFRVVVMQDSAGGADIVSATIEYYVG